MALTKSYLEDLDDAILRGTEASRTRALWHATDLLIQGRYSDEEILTFGKVIGRLADEIEVEVRAQLSERLAHFDSTRGQAHLLAISKRKSIGESVTDVLVARGDQTVVSSVAGNAGARFSGTSLLHMVKRAEGDSILAEQLGLRKDIPRHLFQQLIAKASDDVRKRLEGERPEMCEQIGSSVVDVTGSLQSMFGPVSRSHFVAKRLVTAQFREGNLNEDNITGYALAHRLEEVTIGMSLLCALPIDVIERALVDRTREMLLMLTKALDFNWDTTMALLFLGAKDHRITARELSDLEREFGRLNVATSRSVLSFYRSRKNGDSGVGREAQLAVN
jgi:hypothetical protein